MIPRRRPEVATGMGEADIPYDRSGMSQGISGIPSATGGLKSMKLDFADQAAQEAPQIPPGAGVPPAGMEGGIPPAGMQGALPPDQGGMSPMLAGMSPPQQQQGPDTSMFSDQDLMGMAQDFDPSVEQGDQMFQGMMDPNNPQAQEIQQQLLMAARRGLGGF